MSILHRRCVCRRHERYGRDRDRDRDDQRQLGDQSAGYFRCRQCLARDRRSPVSVMSLHALYEDDAAPEVSSKQQRRLKCRVKCRRATAKSMARTRKEDEGFAPRTPVTPSSSSSSSSEHFDRRKESHFDRLPLELLVRILCYLHHDELQPAFHVCTRFRQAVLIAQQSHFDFQTPSRERQVELELVTPRPSGRWPFASRSSEQPSTPMAPRHAPRPPQARIALGDLKQVAANLFPGNGDRGNGEFRPVTRTVTSHRVLFTEEELCQAVAKNTLELFSSGGRI